LPPVAYGVENAVLELTMPLIDQICNAFMWCSAANSACREWARPVAKRMISGLAGGLKNPAQCEE
jgi:hypothetical protein